MKAYVVEVSPGYRADWTYTPQGVFVGPGAEHRAEEYVSRKNEAYGRRESGADNWQVVEVEVLDETEA